MYSVPSFYRYVVLQFCETKIQKGNILNKRVGRLCHSDCPHLARATAIYHKRNYISSCSYSGSACLFHRLIMAHISGIYRSVVGKRISLCDAWCLSRCSRPWFHTKQVGTRKTLGYNIDDLWWKWLIQPVFHEVLLILFQLDVFWFPLLSVIVPSQTLVLLPS